jgi:mannose-6-phosphate isomerase-like protein (cupin superfamily)
MITKGLATLALFTTLCLPVLVADQADFKLWSASQLDSITAKLQAKMDETKAGAEQLVNSHTHAALLFHREASAVQAEVHERMGDFGIVRKGEGAVLVGGKIEGGKTVQSGEVRGTIGGGTTQKLAAGDIFYVPPGMPHQWQVQPGKQLDVELIKIQPKAGAPQETKFLYWSAAQLNAKDKKLAMTLDEFKNGHEDLTTGGFTTVLLHREGSGPSEVHEHLADFHVVRSGEGFMVLGGKPVGGKITEPGEVRGSSIESGAKQPLKSGDMLYIPANTPHQFVADAGKEFDVIVIKIWTTQ